MIREKRTWKVFLIILFVIALFALHIHMDIVTDKKNAVKVADNYLKIVYDEEMVYSHVTYTIFNEIGEICVWFYMKDIPEVEFYVSVLRDMTINIGNGYSSNNKERTVPDTYYLELFDYRMGEKLNPIVKDIWNEDSFAAMSTFIYWTPIGVHLIPAELNDKLSLDEAENLLNEYLMIFTKQDLNNDDIESEAESIYQFIEYINECDYHPAVYHFCYNNISVDFTKPDESESIESIITTITKKINN